MKILMTPIVLLGLLSVSFICISIIGIRKGYTYVGFRGVGGIARRDTDPILFWVFVSFYFAAGIAMLIAGIWKTINGETLS